MFEGLIAKIAAHAVLGKLVKAGIAAWRWLEGLDFAQLACIALALFGAYQTLGRWSQHRHTVKVEGQLANANKALGLSRANEATLTAAIVRQNAAIDNLVTASKNLQVAATKAKAIAAPRAAEAQATSDRLKQSSRVVPTPAAACEPSNTLKEQWQ